MLPLVLGAALLGCGKAEDSDPDLFNEYTVRVWTEPEAPVAGEVAEIWFQVLDDDGQPIEDLQPAHERVVHVFVISDDLTSFAHVHHEDNYPITADDRRAATYHFPYTFPYSGGFRLAFDFAHENQFYNVTHPMTVGGDVPQLPEPVPDTATTVQVRDVTATISWQVPPVAGQVGEWTLTLADGDQPVNDVVQYLGADGHAALVSDDFALLSHTHAWVEGLEDMGPMDGMPHEYDGPDIPFKYGFPWAGPHKMWLQFTREGDPEPYTAPFWFTVAE